MENIKRIKKLKSNQTHHSRNYQVMVLLLYYNQAEWRSRWWFYHQLSTRKSLWSWKASAVFLSILVGGMAVVEASTFWSWDFSVSHENIWRVKKIAEDFVGDIKALRASHILPGFIQLEFGALLIVVEIFCSRSDARFKQKIQDAKEVLYPAIFSVCISCAR